MYSRLLFLSILLFSQTIRGQTFDTITICNGDSAYVFNNWETVTGNYSTSTGVTTLIVNPTPTLTGNFILNGISVPTANGTCFIVFEIVSEPSITETVIVGINAKSFSFFTFPTTV